MGEETLELVTPGVPIPMYAQLRMGLPASTRLARAWGGWRPDIVHVATEGPLGWSALRTARALQLPVCSDFRTNFHAYGRHYGLGLLHRPIMAYLRRFHNRCQSTMVPTTALQQQLTGAGLRRLSVVARGVDNRLFHPARCSKALRQQWGVLDDDIVVLHVGRLAPEKNLSVVLLAFDAIRGIKPRARLVFVGDGPSRAELQSRCPDAVFAGFRRGEELATCYASSDIFLFPSLTETFGNVTTEAMASALAIVAFDDAAAGALIQHGTHGLLAPPGDVSSFLQCAIDVAANAQWRRSMGAAARARVANLGWDAIMVAIEQVYAQAIRDTHSPLVGCADPPAASALTRPPAQSLRP
jgi:glycosyltransferase involved in cell wall biosynthesis